MNCNNQQATAFRLVFQQSVHRYIIFHQKLFVLQIGFYLTSVSQVEILKSISVLFKTFMNNKAEKSVKLPDRFLLMQKYKLKVPEARR